MSNKGKKDGDGETGGGGGQLPYDGMALPPEDNTKQMWTRGQAYLIRTATHYWVGRLIDFGPNELKIDLASWIPQTGRFSECLQTGKIEEVESVNGEVIVGRYGIIDATMWLHKLPRGNESKK